MKTAIVIRHSKRDHIENPSEHVKTLLNDEGIELARNLGKLLAKEFKSIKVYSSPIQRCIQTGEYMQEAFENSSAVQLSNVLGEPGPFIYGDAIESFSKLGTTGVVEAIENGKSLPLIRSEAEGTKILLDFVRRETSSSEGDCVTVFVTHDACIAPVINFFTGEFFSENHWIEFLGGLKIKFNTNGLAVERWKGVE